MRARARVLGLGIAVMALTMWFLTGVGSGNAADDDEKKVKEIREVVFKLADAIEKNDAAGIKREGDALKKFDLLPVMKQLKLRANGGIGVGKEGTISPDGIEAKLIGMARKPMTEGELKKQGDDLARAAYIMAALAELAKDKCPVKVKTTVKVDNMDVVKDPADWAKWSEDMSKFAKEAAAAAKANDADKLKGAAAKLNSSCNQCHGIFRD